MARLYSNENFPIPVVNFLRDLGHEVITIQETGFSGQAMSDEEVLEYAIHNHLAILTLNRRHFIRLHKMNSDHSGIIVCSFDADFKALAKRIHNEMSNLSTLDGQLIRVNRPQI